MNDYLRESFSYFGLFKKMAKVKKIIEPEYFYFGRYGESSGDFRDGSKGGESCAAFCDDRNKDMYFLYYEPNTVTSDKIIVWVHGGGWNAGNPKFFDYVGQCITGAGYRFVSIGYRLSPKHKYPCQINDVCAGFNATINFLRKKNIDTSKIIVVGPSAGAHLTSILCYSKDIQQSNHVDISPIIGYIGFGGPYSFRDDNSKTLKMLLNQLFKKGDDKKTGEPVSMMTNNHIPMLLIQSKHDGLISFKCAEDFAKKAADVGNSCEIYSVIDKKNTHSWYTAGLFLETREENKALDKFFTWIEQL
ncbi:MAG: alpha/beta hydrolase [Treponemataceae bacterium]|nr:alpha/beta hydrolase [Treponemataceae bacterium]